MWRKTLTLALAAAMLIPAFLIFVPSLSSAPDVVGEILGTVGKILTTEEPEYVTVKIRVLEVDLGHSQTYLGNESSPSIPLSHIYVRIGGKIGLTDERGEVILTVPKGNQSIIILRRPQNIWSDFIDVKDGMELEIIFYLFRLEASKVEVEAEVFKAFTHVKLDFKLPSIGEYYVGKPVITYYTPWGELKVYWPGGLAERLITPDEVWDMIEIDYTNRMYGNVTLTLSEDVKGIGIYIIPWRSFLPVERVEVREK